MFYDLFERAEVDEFRLTKIGCRQLPCMLTHFSRSPCAAACLLPTPRSKQEYFAYCGRLLGRVLRSEPSLGRGGRIHVEARFTRHVLQALLGRAVTLADLQQHEPEFCRNMRVVRFVSRFCVCGHLLARMPACRD